MEALGIEPKLLIVQIVNFLIVLFLLRKFLYGPVVSMLEDRSKKIESGLKDSEEASKRLEKAELEAEKITEKAYKEANDILEKAKKESGAKSAEILKRANDQAMLIMKNAEEEAGLAKEKAMARAKSELSDVVLLALDKIVGTELDGKTKENLTAKAIKEL